MSREKDILEMLQKATGALVAILVMVVLLSLSSVYLFFFYEPSPEPAPVAATEKVQPTAQEKATTTPPQQGGKDEATGLIIDDGWELAKANCTGCHAATLVTQNRATREGWEGMIRWMQRTQKLWDLGENEEAILDYLAKNYAPESKGRRPNLTDIEWYELEGTK